KLARVGRERFDVTTLALGVERIECQARFARAARPREHDESIFRNGQPVDTQVVLARAGDFDQLATLCPRPGLRSAKRTAAVPDSRLCDGHSPAAHYHASRARRRPIEPHVPRASSRRRPALKSLAKFIDYETNREANVRGANSTPGAAV